MTTTYERVVAVLAESLSADPAVVRPESRLVADLGADSLDLLELLFRAEEEFGIRLDREELFPELKAGSDLDAVLTASALADRIGERLKAAGRPR